MCKLCFFVWHLGQGQVCMACRTTRPSRSLKSHGPPMGRGTRTHTKHACTVSYSASCRSLDKPIVPCFVLTCIAAILLKVTRVHVHRLFTKRGNGWGGQATHSRKHTTTQEVDFSRCYHPICVVFSFLFYCSCSLVGNSLHIFDMKALQFLTFPYL